MNPKLVIIVSAFFAMVGGVSVVMQLVLQRSVDTNILRYVALRVSTIMLRGENVFWDDMVRLYKEETQLLVGIEGSLTYEEGRRILSFVKEFLTKHLPLGSERWQPLVRNAQRSIPLGTHANSEFTCMGILLFAVIWGMFNTLGALRSTASPDWGTVAGSTLPLLPLLVYIGLDVWIVRGLIRVTQALRALEKSTLHSLGFMPAPLQYQ